MSDARMVHLISPRLGKASLWYRGQEHIEEGTMAKARFYEPYTGERCHYTERKVNHLSGQMFRGEVLPELVAVYCRYRISSVYNRAGIWVQW